MSKKRQKKMKAIWVVIFIAIIIAVFYLWQNKPREKYVAQPEAENFEWKDLSKTDLFNIVAKEFPEELSGFCIDPKLGLNISEVIDLTGDGKDEAIVSGAGCNNDTSFILLRNLDDKISIAKEKLSDGDVGSAYLVNIGRAMINSSYKLIPKEKGYYTVDLFFDESADNSESPHFKCDDGSVNAYTWNSTEKLFEWSKSLTTKYTREICG